MIDHELIRLGNELDLAWAKENMLPEEVDQDVFDATTDVGSKIVKQIIALQPHTIEGARVLAKAVAWCHANEVDFGPEPDCVLASTVIRFLNSAQST